MSEPSFIDGHVDHEVPWALQVVLRVNRTDPPGRHEACEAAARAVVALLASDEARSGAWRESVQFWRDGRIRKIVRRARGVRWDEVQDLPGVTVTQGRAAARALVPAPVRPLPPVLGKLQVEGTELPDLGPSGTSEAFVTVGISPLVRMTTGKAAAQCAHAAQLAWEAMGEDERARWAQDAYRVRVVDVPEAVWAAEPGDVHVVDAGYTELDGPTETTRAWWARGLPTAAG